MIHITMRELGRISSLAALVLLLGCEGSDRRLDNLHVGMTRDSVKLAMDGAEPRRVDPYLNGGKYIEAMFFPRAGKTDPESLADRKMSPVVVIDGKVAGWGWGYWDSVATANRIEVPQ